LQIQTTGRVRSIDEEVQVEASAVARAYSGQGRTGSLIATTSGSLLENALPVLLQE
jgi:hypothetical protein